MKKSIFDDTVYLFEMKSIERNVESKAKNKSEKHFLSTVPSYTLLSLTSWVGY